MSVFEQAELRESTGRELEVITERTRNFAEEMTKQGNLSEEVLGSEEEKTEARARRVASFVVDVFDFIDSIDHETSSEMGGTDEIQTYALKGREAAREFIRTINPD